MTRLTLRYLTRDDLPFADSLRAVAGWNQTLADWIRFLDLSPRGCLLAECDGRPAGTVVTLTYGLDLGWIGMMLVHPDFRRRGIARVLMCHSIEILQNAGVKAIKLDATSEGREVYSRIGFKDEFTVTRFRREGTALTEASTSLRVMQPDDLSKIADLDRAATGASRLDLLQRLLTDSTRALVYDYAGQITGFGFLRPGSIAAYLGPVVSTDPAHAAEIATALAHGPVICDLPEQNPVASPWARSQQFVPQRTLTRMYLGANVQPSAPESYFAIAAPDIG